eukprot:13494-Heterococcus_DN1.PRE.3
MLTAGVQCGVCIRVSQHALAHSSSARRSIHQHCYWLPLSSLVLRRSATAVLQLMYTKIAWCTHAQRAVQCSVHRSSTTALLARIIRHVARYSALYAALSTWAAQQRMFDNPLSGASTYSLPAPPQPVTGHTVQYCLCVSAWCIIGHTVLALCELCVGDGYQLHTQYQSVYPLQ